MTTPNERKNIAVTAEALNPSSVGNKKGDMHISIRLSERMYADLQAIMSEREWTKSQTLREALRLYLQDQLPQKTDDGDTSQVDFPEN